MRIKFALGLLAFITACLLSPAADAPEISHIVTLPFEVKSGYIVFSVSFEALGTMDLLMDTGCQTTVFNEESLGAHKDRPLYLQLGSEVLKIDKFHVHPLSRHPQAIGQEIDGVIGNDLFHNFTVKLDFKQNTLHIFDSEGFIANPDGEDIQLNVNSLVSSLNLSLTLPDGKQLHGEFVIDTGAPIALVLNSPAAKKLGLDVNPQENRTFKTQADVQTAVEVLADSIRIGTMECKSVPIYVSTSDKGLFAVKRYAGLVGTGLLKHFQVIFDYKRNRLNLETINRRSR